MPRLPILATLVAFFTGTTAAFALGTAAIGPTSYYGAYTPTVLNYAGTRGGMLVEVIENPFEQATEEEVARSIAGTMATSHFGPRIPFITSRPDDFASPYRVVILFDGVQAITPYRVCSQGVGYGPGVRNDTAPGVVRLHAVLCGDGNPLSAVSGQVSDIDGPNDPAFRQLVGQMSILLFPPRKPAQGSRDRALTP